MLSSGARKDLLILCFVKSVIDVSVMEETKQDKSLPSRDENKTYKLNKRIDRNLLSLGNKLHETIDSLYKIGGNETVTWIRKNLSKRIGGTLTKLQEEKINLEMLALWVMYCNFSEIKRPLHEKLQWTTDGEQYTKIVDLMEGTKIADMNGDMFQAAYDVIARIKG